MQNIIDKVKQTGEHYELTLGVWLARGDHIMSDARHNDWACPKLEDLEVYWWGDFIRIADAEELDCY